MCQRSTGHRIGSCQYRASRRKRVGRYGRVYRTPRSTIRYVSTGPAAVHSYSHAYHHTRMTHAHAYRHTRMAHSHAHSHTRIGREGSHQEAGRHPHLALPLSLPLSLRLPPPVYHTPWLSTAYGVA
eukprot:3213258-Rhodomonas_salina.2